MVQVVVSRDKWDELMGLNEPFDLCDESGRVFARATLTKSRANYENLVIPHTQDEIEQAFSDPGVPFEHVMKRLRDLESQS